MNKLEQHTNNNFQGFNRAFPKGHAMSDQLTWTYYRMILEFKLGFLDARAEANA